MRKIFWLVLGILSLFMCVFLAMKGDNSKAEYFLIAFSLITIYLGMRNIPKA